MAAELVVIDLRVAQPKTGLDSVPGARPGIVVVLDQVVLDQRLTSRAKGVEFDAGHIRLDDVIENPGSANICCVRAGIHPYPRDGAGIGHCRSLNREPVQDGVVGRDPHGAAYILDDRLCERIGKEGTCSGVDVSPSAEQRQIVLADGDHLVV